MICSSDRCCRAKAARSSKFTSMPSRNPFACSGGNFGACRPAHGSSAAAQEAVLSADLVFVESVQLKNCLQISSRHLQLQRDSPPIARNVAPPTGRVKAANRNIAKEMGSSPLKTQKQPPQESLRTSFLGWRCNKPADPQQSAWLEI